MSGPSSARPWPTRAVPASTGGWHWDLTALAELPAARAELIRRVAARDDEVVVERLVLTFDEMASNALRHGSGAVRACVRETPGHWLVEVQDGARYRPPRPAVGRDPSLGGFGLHLIADMASAHGWWPDDDCKWVWATIPRS